MGKVMPNAQQRKVVEAIEGPILISAGPGTGKTATLVNRYANMVNNHHIKPKNIMMVTFTEKAAKEIITRISAMVPKRIKEIEEMTENVSAGKIYVTAFLGERQ